MECTNKKKRTLHRNMFLPFYGAPDPDEIEIPLPRQQPADVIPSSDSSEGPLSNIDSSDDGRDYRQEKTESAAEYVIPPHSYGWQNSNDPVHLPAFGSRQPLHRGKLKRRPPERLEAADWHTRAKGIMDMC